MRTIYLIGTVVIFCWFGRPIVYLDVQIFYLVWAIVYLDVGIFYLVGSVVYLLYLDRQYLDVQIFYLVGIIYI